MNTAILYNKHRLHLQHHIQWNVVTPQQYVAWIYLDGRQYPINVSTRPAPMPWGDISDGASVPRMSRKALAGGDGRWFFR